MLNTASPIASLRVTLMLRASLVSCGNEVFSIAITSPGQDPRALDGWAKIGAAMRPRAHSPMPGPQYGSDLVVDLLRAVGIKHVAINPGATFRGLHDSLVNYGANGGPELILTTHEEI